MCLEKFAAQVVAIQGGAACSNSRPQLGAKTFGGLGGGGGGRWVGRSAAGVPRGGSVGTPTYIPQNDPYDALIILNIHKWGKRFFQKKLPIRLGSHQPRSDPEVSWGQKICCVFQTFLNSPQNSEYFEYRHIG